MQKNSLNSYYNTLNISNLLYLCVYVWFWYLYFIHIENSWLDLCLTIHLIVCLCSLFISFIWLFGLNVSFAIEQIYRKKNRLLQIECKYSRKTIVKMLSMGTEYKGTNYAYMTSLFESTISFHCDDCFLRSLMESAIQLNCWLSFIMRLRFHCNDRNIRFVIC